MRNQEEEGRKPGSVPPKTPGGDDHSSGAAVADCLKRPNPEASGEQPVSHLDPPCSGESEKGNASLFWSCTGWGLPNPGVATGIGALLPHRFTLAKEPRTLTSHTVRGPGGLFSVALSLGSPPLEVIQHPALRSPDFPPPHLMTGGDHLAFFFLEKGVARRPAIIGIWPSNALAPAGLNDWHPVTEHGTFNPDSGCRTMRHAMSGTRGTTRTGCWAAGAEQGPCVPWPWVAQAPPQQPSGRLPIEPPPRARALVTAFIRGNGERSQKGDDIVQLVVFQIKLWAA